MIKNSPGIAWAFLLLLTCLHCSPQQNTDEQPEETASTNLTASAPAIPVKTQKATQGSFALQTITSGKLQAAQQAEIQFQAGGTIQQLPITEGQFVQKGTLMASINDTLLQFSLAQARLNLEDAISQKQDLLVANGGQAGVDTSVSADKLEIIHMMSGYNKALQQIEQAEYELRRAKVHSPFPGLVAELEVRPFQSVSPGEKLCRLLNPNSFEVEFQLLEKEALQVRKGQSLKVIPLANESLSIPAFVQTITPIVNEQGLVTIKARLSQVPSSGLFEGMNVRVILEQHIPNQIIIPRSALVLRSGREVVFTYEPNEQLAKWKYVTIAYENEDQLAVSEGIEAGDLVIYEGNLNLAHDAEVTIN